MSAVQWIIIAIICGAIEIFSAGFWFVWLALTALIVAIGVKLSLLNSLEIQLFVYALITFLFILLARPLIMKFIKTDERVSNVDALIGQHGVTISELKPLQFGQVKLKGEVWTAVSDEEIPIDTRVVIEAIEGVKLKVRKA
ncbi:MAG TPA: NfeD family protein [Syntrophomonadaceae bacterium]|nr:NfeD family protein [Syntrophomonadaceae bacterium]